MTTLPQPLTQAELVPLTPQHWRTRQAWDTFQSLVATARKLGVNIYHYLRDRLCGTT